MFLRRIIENLRVQNWTAIAIDFTIVVVGVYLGMQVNNWNQARSQKAATERMLVQLAPELRSQIEYFDSLKVYFETTRRYADQAFAGWKHDPRISDQEFVIAAYQASQITGITIDPQSWSLTFGGEQLRNIDDSEVRRALEVVMTSDYSVVEYTAIATAYREKVRHIMPTEIQDAIRRECGDRNVRMRSGAIAVVLPPSCGLKLDPAEAAKVAAALRTRLDLADELNWHLAAVAAFRLNLDILALQMKDLYGQLSPGS